MSIILGVIDGCFAMPIFNKYLFLPPAMQGVHFMKQTAQAKSPAMPRLEVSTDARMPLYCRIAEALCRALLSGQLKPGQRLPARDALAKALQTSPVTVGRGYEWLHGRGLVEQKRRSGTWIRPDALALLRRDAPTAPNTPGLNPNPDDARFSEIVVVLGKPDLAGLNRDTLEIVTPILTGVADMLGERLGRYRYVESFDPACLETLRDDSAVLNFNSSSECCSVASSLHELGQRNIPVLGIWGHNEIPGLPRIDYSPYQAVNLACRHLLDCGYRRLGYIGGMGHDLAPKFFEFTNVLFKAGLDFQFSHVREAGLRPGAAYRAATEIAQNDLPDAFFVDADWKAMEVVAALTHAGVRVPGDVGVVGYGDIPDLQNCKPRLTTVRIPRREIGQAVGRQLIAWRQHQTPLHSVILDSELIVRDSTAHVDAAAAPKPDLSTSAAE